MIVVCDHAWQVFQGSDALKVSWRCVKCGTEVHMDDPLGKS